MTLSDPIADLLTRMRNAQHGRQPACRIPWSVIKESICNLLKQHKFVAGVGVEGEGVEKKIVVTFRTDRNPLSLTRISTPGNRKYVGFTGIRPLLHGASMAIVSTSSGLLTDKEAFTKKTGGEVLCTVA